MVHTHWCITLYAMLTIHVCYLHILRSPLWFLLQNIAANYQCPIVLHVYWYTVSTIQAFSTLTRSTIKGPLGQAGVMGVKKIASSKSTIHRFASMLLMTFCFPVFLSATPAASVDHEFLDAVLWDGAADHDGPSHGPDGVFLPVYAVPHVLPTPRLPPGVRVQLVRGPGTCPVRHGHVGLLLGSGK